GLTTPQALSSPAERAIIGQTTAAVYLPEGEVPATERAELLDALLALDIWPSSYDGGPESAAALKNLTSELIGRFCVAAERATRGTYPGRPLSRYDADLVVPRRQRLECAL